MKTEQAIAKMRKAIEKGQRAQLARDRAQSEFEQLQELLRTTGELPEEFESRNCFHDCMA